MRYKVCSYPWFSPIISCYGDVGVCCNDIHFELKVGNIKQDSLKNIWLNKKAESLRFQHITNQLPEICLKCRKSLEVPTLNDEYVIDYLNTIHREDLIDFYLNRIRENYGIDFQFKEEGNSHIYPIYPNLIKTKHFRIKGEYVGSDEKLTFYLKIPKNISLLQIKLPLTGIKGKSTFTAILNNKSLGTFTVNQMSKGDAEIIELITEDVQDLIKKEIVKFELKINKGNLAIYEQAKNTNLKGITLSYGNEDLLIHGKRLEYHDKNFKLLGTDGKISSYLKIPKNISLLQIKLPLTGIKGKSTFTAILNNKPLGTFIVNQMSEGNAEIVELITEDVKDLIKKEIVKFELKVLKGNLAIYEQAKNTNLKGITLSYGNEDLLIHGKRLEYHDKNFKLLGTDGKISSYLKIPKNISLLQIKLPLTGIKGKSTFTAILNNKPLGTFTVNQMSEGDAEIIELITEDVKDLIKKEIVKFELKINKGNLAIYEQAKNTNLKGITLSYGNEDLLIHGKRFENKDFKLLGTDGIFFIKNNKKVQFVQIKLQVTAIEQDAKINNILIHKMATGEYETVTMIIENPHKIIPLKVDGTVAIYNNQFQLIYPEPFKPSNQYSIYTPYRNGTVIEYNNQDNFNKGYKFLILEENSELFYPLKEEINTIQIQLASIDKNTIAQINSTEIQPIPLASGKGKIYSIKTKGNLIKIKCFKGKLAVLQEPLEKDLPKTPIIIDKLFKH